MTDQPKPKKKVVHTEASASDHAADTSTTGTAKGDGPVWTPTTEAKGKATQFRVIAWIGWLLAIGLEAVLIFWVLRQNPVNMWLLIGGIVVIGALASVGSFFWKKANRLDPASSKDKVRFFIQNQLGAIMSIIAFLPLIILIFTNKNMDGKQKALAGSIGIVVAVVAVAVFGIDYAPPSQEQYAQETAAVTSLTGGKDSVYWVKGGSVFHLCESVPDVNRESKDGTISEGTVAQAHAAGKERLTKKWENEALNYCGYTQEQVDSARAAFEAASADVPGEN
ncbi:MAG: hypothetical protein J0H64_06050 [Actinobacteria bacterium]|nr:hypothetical protein [Actinomycetota bacterium]